MPIPRRRSRRDPTPSSHSAPAHRPVPAARTRLAVLVALAAAGAGAACATPSASLPDVAPEDVAAEQAIQQRLVLRHAALLQARMDSLLYPLLVAAAPLCADDVRPATGFRARTLHAVPDPDRDAARDVLGLDDTLRIATLTPGGPAHAAGLERGDRLVAINDRPLPTGKGADLELQRRLHPILDGSDSLLVTVRRGAPGIELSYPVRARPACDYEAVVLPAMSINAFADGDAIYATTALMRFADDHELLPVLAHELAHNARGHLDAARRNATIGASLGLLLDLATLAAGDTLPDVPYSLEYGVEGAQSYSADFEREADHVALYILALADVPLERAPDIFRLFAASDPRSIAYSGTHPSSAERFVRMTATIAEIRAKRAAGQPLTPDPR